jgi:hypothetical protein
MPLASAPDFAVPVHGEGFRLFRTYDHSAFVVVPNHLVVAVDVEGRPSFRLEMVRGERPSLPPEPHGRLYVEFRPAFPQAAALERARDHDPAATVRRVQLSRGRVRFLAGEGVEGWPERLTKAQALVDDGRGRSILDTRLRLKTATAVRHFLKNDLLHVQAIVDADLVGVPPRADVAVTFDPADLVGTLRERDDRRYERLVDVLEEAVSGAGALPVTVDATVASVQRARAAEALASRLYREYGQPASSESGDAWPCVAWRDDVLAGTVTWDLSQEIIAPRPVTLTVDPLQAAREVVEVDGLDVVSPTIVVPSIKSGQHRVEVVGNLPSRRDGVIEAGVELEVPAAPPFRPQTQHHAVVLTPPQDRGQATFRFSPIESPKVQVSTYVILRTEEGIERYRSSAWTSEDDRLLLPPSAFPGTFVAIEAGRGLLRMAHVHVACTYRVGDVEEEAHVELTLDVPESAIVLPPDAEARELSVRAVPHGLGDASAESPQRQLHVEGLPTDVGVIDLHHFPEYGPHTIRVEASVADGELMALDIRPEGRPDQVSTLHFTSSKTSRTWSWTAASPFQAGYEYRMHDAPDGVGWTLVASPFEDLALQRQPRDSVGG